MGLVQPFRPLKQLKSQFITLSQHTTVSGRRASDSVLFRNNIVISSTSWHGRVMILPALPLKPPFFYRLLLHVLSCVIATISDFLFFLRFSRPFFTCQFGCSDFLSAFCQIWPLSVFLRNILRNSNFMKVYF